MSAYVKYGIAEVQQNDMKECVCNEAIRLYTCSVIDSVIWPIAFGDNSYPIDLEALLLCLICTFTDSSYSCFM